MNTVTGLPDSASPAIDPSSPDWEHIQRDIRCPLCEYNLRGLIESRCPECGYRFVWFDLLDPRNVHPYLFEQARIDDLTAFAKTLVRNREPGQFWRTLRPHMPLSGTKLLVYWFFCAVIASLPAILVASIKLTEISVNFIEAT